jgi:hypothetical protein
MKLNVKNIRVLGRSDFDQIPEGQPLEALTS